MNEEKRQQVIALGRLGWPLRRIEKVTGIRRETAGAYLQAAGFLYPQTGETVQWGVPRLGALGNDRPWSVCEPHREFIELSLSKGRNAKAAYQDLVDDHGLAERYQSVKRFVRQLGEAATPEACAIFIT